MRIIPHCKGTAFSCGEIGVWSRGPGRLVHDPGPDRVHRRPTMRRIMRGCIPELALFLSAAAGLAGDAKPKEPGKSEPPGVPLEARLVVKKDSYVLDLGGMSPDEFRKLLQPFPAPPPAPKVDLVLELRNTGDKPLKFWKGNLHLDLKGPGAVAVLPRAIARPSNQGFPDRPPEVQLEPGKSHALPITS